MSSATRLADYLCRRQDGEYLRRVAAYIRSGAKTAGISDFQNARQHTLREAQSSHASLKPRDSLAFLQALYPKNIYLSRLEAKNDSFDALPVSHSELYKQYCLLPQPGILHISPKDIDPFLLNFFNRRDFARPSFLSAGNSHLSYFLPAQIIKAHFQQQKIRKNHLAACLHVLKDLRSLGMDLLTPETDEFLYMYFFKDHPAVVLAICNAASKKNKHKIVDQVQSPRLTWESFQNTRQLLPDPLPISTLNVLLFCAFRNNCHEVSEHLVAQVREKQVLPDPRFFRILLQHHALERLSENLSHTLDWLLNDYLHFIDIRVANAAVEALLACGFSRQATEILRVLLAPPEEPWQNHDFLRLLTPDDKAVYEQCPLETPHRLFPTNHTVQLLLQGIPEITGVWSQLISANQHFGLPPTTSALVGFFDKAHHLPLAQLLDCAKQTLAFEESANPSSDLNLRDKLAYLRLPDPHQQLLVDTLLIPPSYTPPKRATFVKLSNMLLLSIYNSFIEASRQNNPTLLKKLSEHKQTLFKNLRQPAQDNLYVRDQYVYLKKAFLIDMLVSVEEALN